MKSKVDYYKTRIDMLSHYGIAALNAEIEAAANDDDITNAEYTAIYDYALAIVMAM